MHQVERLVDPLQRQDLADHPVDMDFACRVTLHITGQLRAALDPAKCRTAPLATSHQLEWLRADLLLRAATPMMIDSPQPLEKHSSTGRITDFEERHARAHFLDDTAAFMADESPAIVPSDRRRTE